MKAFVHSLNDLATIALYGPTRLPLHDLAIKHGADSDKICIIKAPGDSSKIGYQNVAQPKFGIPNQTKFDVYSEGVILTEKRSAAIIRPADCPTLVLYELVQGRGVITHAGRSAMTPTNSVGKPLRNIVTIAYDAVTDNHPDPYVFAYITGSICGHCFIHDNPGAEKLVKPFDQFGSHAFTNRSTGALNLVEIAKQQLLQLGVLDENIKHDGLCTYESDWLGSYRRNQNEVRNAVVVVLH